MPMSKLNPAAPAFVPSSWPSQYWEDLDSSEDHISQSELDELEAVEDWCAAMASIEEEEAQYLIDLALDLAPPERVAEVEHEALARTR